MRNLEENLTQYAAYHRDRRNIATHFLGIPLIVLAVVIALDVASVPVAGLNVSAAALASIAACAYYLRLDVPFALAMAAVLFAMCAAASEINARLSDPASLGLAAAVFAAGWTLQFLGHRYEGMKPAFFDDAKQLAIGPLFVVAEIAFLFGARAALRRYIEDRVGPTVARRDGAPLSPHS